MAMAVKTGTLACSFIFAALLSVALSACKQGSVGSASAVAGTGPWSWSCAGSAGGSTAQCSAPKNTGPVSGGAGSGTSNTLVAPTYAAARLLVGVNSGDRLQVLGRTSLSDGGQGLFTWVPGGTTTVDEGYVLQATRGTWQRVDPSPTTGETFLNAVWYNIKPTNSDITNDIGFTKLKAQMQTSGTTTWHVFFPPGAYTYINNRWLFGVQKVIIDAYDASFQCTSAAANNGNKTTFQVRDMFDNAGDVVYPGTQNYASGYLFNTASAGSTSITTTTAADAGTFSAGMRVLIGGYDQQGLGYPPNYRYFEYKTVLTAVAGTGVITFTNPLANSYDSRWWDTPNYGGITGFSAGAPRILSLERANYTQAKLIWIKGAALIANPNLDEASPAGSEKTVYLQADLLIYEDVTAPSLEFAEMNTGICRRCHITGGYHNVADKIMNKVLMEDTTSDADGVTGLSIEDSTGTNSVSLIRCRLFGAISANPRNLFISDSDVIPRSTAHYPMGDVTTNPIRTVTIQNTRLFNTGSVFYGWSNTALSLTVGSVIGTDIILSSFDMTSIPNAARQAAISIEYGMTLTNTVTGNTGVITAIHASGANLRIAGTWSAPSPGDVFHYYDVMLASDGGGNVIVGPQVPFWRGPPGP